MKKLALILLLSGCNMAPAFAQAPQLNKSEQVAIAALSEKLAENDKERKALLNTYSEIATEFAKNHPGYHLDPKTAQVQPDAVEKK